MAQAAQVSHTGDSTNQLVFEMKAMIEAMNLDEGTEKFPKKSLSSLRQLTAEIDKLVSLCDERKESSEEMLELYISYPSKLEEVLKEISSLENIHHKISCLKSFIQEQMVDDKSYTKDMMKVSSELYNKLHYAVWAASGKEAVRIMEKTAEMYERTKDMSEQKASYCFGDDLFNQSDSDDY